MASDLEMPAPRCTSRVRNGLPALETGASGKKAETQALSFQSHENNGGKLIPRLRILA